MVSYDRSATENKRPDSLIIETESTISDGLSLITKMESMITAVCNQDYLIIFANQ